MPPYDDFIQPSEEKKGGGEYLIRIYFHILRTSEGLGGQSKQTLPIIMDNLNTAFNEHGIAFVSACEVNYIDDDTYFTGALTSPNYDNLRTPYNHIDGVDIFLGDKKTSFFGGISLKGESALWVQGEFLDRYEVLHDLVKTHVVSHEMGHCLGLFHTYESTVGGPGAPLAELVNGSNSAIAGDYITDTNANPGISPGAATFLNGELHINLDENCNWIPHLDLVDINGEQYMPDPANIMNTTIPTCTQLFTAEQGVWMLTYLLSDIYALNDCIISDITSTDIISDTEWTLADADANGDIFLSNNLTVKDGNVLTIEVGVAVHFAGATKLIIEPNAQVFLEGTLTGTNDCGQWLGVEVQGNQNEESHSQFLYNGRVEQGRLFTNYGAKIENALTAVKLYGPNIANTGGQIYATGTTFRNNSFGIKYGNYQNYWPHAVPPSFQGQPRSYRGTIRSCHFENTIDYLLSEPFIAFIDLFHTKDVSITANTFINNQTVTDAKEINDYGYGIKSINSKFTVQHSCTWDEYNCTPDETNYFKGLGYAINANSSITSQPYIVKNAEFRNCFVGIRNRLTSNATIVNNKFYLGNLPDLSVDTNEEAEHQTDQVGILIEYTAEGYTIEENEFLEEVGGNISDDSKGATIGTLSKSTQNFNNKIRRNTFDGVTFGNVAVGKNGINQQGAKGLVFLCNDYHNGSLADMFLPSDDNPGDNTVNPQQAALNDNNYAIPTGNSFFNSTSSFINKANLSIHYVHNSTNSNETLINPVNIFPDGVFNNENTCATKYCLPPCKTISELQQLELDFYVYNNEKQTLKIDYEAAINSGNSILIKEKEDALSFVQHKMDKTTYTIALHSMYDTTTFDQSVQDIWLLNKKTFGTDILLASQKATTGQYTAANLILANMPSRFSWSSEEATQSTQLASIFPILETASSAYLDKIELADLKLLTGNENPIAAISQSILCTNGFHYTPKYNLSQTKAKSLLPKVSKKVNSAEVFTVYPNPSSGWVTFEFPPKEINAQSLLLEIIDLNGKVTSSKLISPLTTSVQIDMTEKENGIYFYHLSSNNTILESGRFLILK